MNIVVIDYAVSLAMNAGVVAPAESPRDPNTIYVLFIVAT